MKLVTQRDAVRMQINAERREINSVADYMRLYLKILHLVFEQGIISAMQRDGIANSILVAIQNAAEGEEIIVANYIYVISMRFMTLSNYDCWELMSKITCQEEANNFVAETKSWFWERVCADVEKAEQAHKLSFNLRNAAIISTWEKYLKLLKEMCGCLEPGSKFNLKSRHSEALDLPYMVIHTETGLTYLERVEDYLRMFGIETSVLVKIDADKIIKAILKQRSEKIQIKNSLELERAKQDVKDAEDTLAKFEAFYAEKLKKALASEEAYGRIYDEFEDAHSDLSEDEFEDAFDKYWMSCPEYFPDDYLSVETEYRQKRVKLQGQLTASKRHLDNLEDEMATVQDAMQEIGSTVTLEDILKEYTIAFLVQEGHIAYPTTPSEKEQVFSKISPQMAAKVFLQKEGDNIGLSAEEISYLMN